MNPLIYGGSEGEATDRTEEIRMNYTPEPWEALDDKPNDELAGSVVLAASTGEMIADCNIMLRGRTPAVDRANHLRIVACVNALAGIADPAAYRAKADAAIALADSIDPHNPVLPLCNYADYLAAREKEQE